ncbi:MULTISPECIES: hypothetical protein [unclassified Nonomuraea]|uniref:hypothetical protein n=1 Tax=unclassified Nonomuraea TaxID=2593643 RepID=UPI0034010663
MGSSTSSALRLGGVQARVSGLQLAAVGQSAGEGAVGQRLPLGVGEQVVGRARRRAGVPVQADGDGEGL